MLCSGQCSAGNLFRDSLKNMIKTFLRCCLGVQILHAGPTNLIQGGPTSQLAGLKGSAANVMVPDTTGHIQRSYGVHYTALRP